MRRKIKPKRNFLIISKIIKRKEKENHFQKFGGKSVFSGSVFFKTRLTHINSNFLQKVTIQNIYHSSSSSENTCLLGTCTLIGISGVLGVSSSNKVLRGGDDVSEASSSNKIRR